MNIFGIFLGFFIGMVTGMIGLHINDILPITYSFGFEFIVSSTVCWYFFSLVPAILLRIPEDSNYIVLNKLNKEVLKGNGLKILENTVFNCFVITVISLSVLSLYHFFIVSNYGISKIVLFLIVLSFVKSLKHVFLLFLCFCFGMITFNTGQDLLFPILSGLFAMPVYLTSKKYKTVYQKYNNRVEIKKELFPSLLISSFFASFPALSSSISAIFTKKVLKNMDMVFLMLFSDYSYLVLSVLYYEKIRSASSYYLTFFDFNYLQLIFIVLFSASFSAFLILLFSKYFNKLTGLYKPRFFLIFLILLTLYIYGIYGLVILVTASVIGLLCNFWNIERSILISTLIFPMLFV